MLGEINHTQKNKHFMISHMKLKLVKLIEAKRRMEDARDEAEGEMRR